jgi:hypothetical protein
MLKLEQLIVKRFSACEIKVLEGGSYEKMS